MGRLRLHRGPSVAGDDDEEPPLTPADARTLARAQHLQADPRVIAAARIGATFSLDPVMVLDERRPLARLIRLAAHNVIVADENRRNSGK